MTGCEYSMPVYEMMARLGIDPGEGVLPRLSMRYARRFGAAKIADQKKLAAIGWTMHPQW